MPELPDVALFEWHLGATVLRREIASLQVNDSRVLVGVSVQALARRLKGACFTGTRRHGKHLLVQVDKGGWLTLHFGMTGGLQFFEESAEEPPYDRVRFDFEGGGHLAYTSRRLLGRVGFAEDADHFIAQEKLGPDALDPTFNLPAFRKVFSKGRRGIKSALMDQSTMAGVGNIYSDEILFQAGVRPDTRVEDLDEEDLARLFATMKGVLTRAVELGAGSEQFLERVPADWLLPHRHKDGRCPRCGAALRKLKASGRTAYYCARCQTGSAPRDEDGKAIVPIHNAEIAEILNNVADLLEIEEANPFRIRAYRNAARTITNLPQSVASMLKQNQDLSQQPGIGKDLAGKRRYFADRIHNIGALVVPKSS